MTDYKLNTKRSIILITVLLLIGIATKNVLQSLKTTPPKKTVEKRKQNVDVINVKNGVVIPIVSAHGVLKAKQRWAIRSEVSGRLDFNFHDFEIGKVYKKGETIVSIIAPDIEFQVKRKRSEFITFLAQLVADISIDYHLVSTNLKHYMLGLSSNKAIPELPVIQDKQAVLLLTVKQLYSQFYTVRQLESQLDKYRIIAPFDGVITAKYVELGDTVSTGQSLADFIATHTFESTSYVNRDEAEVLMTSKPVRVLNSRFDLIGTGRVTFISNAVDESTQTIAVGTDINGNSRLVDGEFVTLELTARPFENAIEVSRKLLQDDNSIYTVENDLLKKIYPTIVFKTESTLIIKDIPDQTQVVSHQIPGAFEGLYVSVQTL